MHISDAMAGVGVRAVGLQLPKAIVSGVSFCFPANLCCSLCVLAASFHPGK